MLRVFLFAILLISGAGVQAQSIVRIGAPLPLTGKLSLEAAKQQRGYDLWAMMANAQGGILIGDTRHRVEIVYADYRSDGALVRETVETLVRQGEVDLLFAPYGSKAAREASPVAQLNRIPMIAVTASSQQAYSRGHDYLFGIFTPNATLTEPLTDLVQRELPEINRVAMMVRSDLFPKSIARAFVYSMRKRKIELVYHYEYAIDATDHSTALSALRETGAGWLISLGYTEDLLRLRAQIDRGGVNPRVHTMLAAPAYQEFIDEAGALAEDVISASWWHPAVRFTGVDIFGSTEEFVRRFRERYGSLPDYVEASAALAGALFQIGLERAGAVDGALVRDQLARFNDVTFWGHVRFGSNGQNESSKPLVFQIQEGMPVILHPPEVATGSFRSRP